MLSATLPPTIANASPFLLKVQDVDILSQSDGFNIMRQHLATHYTYDLCDKHTPAHLEDVDSWLIVRDVLHALLVPIVELFDKACAVAASATHAARLEDLEFAFTGQARSAFVWLQCFLSSEIERDWCYTRGCPACVVGHSLDSEFTIRLLHAACLLSDVHYPFTIDGPTLPSFMFFLESLQRATEEDDLYGPDFFEMMQPKAGATRDGVEELIHRCLELDILLSQQLHPDVSTPELSLSASPVAVPLGAAQGMKIKRSEMAQQLMRLEQEEEQWLEGMLKNCLGKVQPQIQDDALAPPVQSLDALVKVAVSVVVDEIAPE